MCHTNSILKVDNNPISCSGHPILRTNLVTSIKVELLMLSQKLFLNSKFLSNKVICTSATCTESGFIHAGCLRAIEDVLIHYLTSRHKRWIFNFQFKFRQLLCLNIGLALGTPTSGQSWKILTGVWTKTGLSSGTLNMEGWLLRYYWNQAEEEIFSQVGKMVRCRCGGFLRRDLDWPPPQTFMRRDQKRTLLRPKTQTQTKNTGCTLLEEREDHRGSEVWRIV